MSKKPTNNIPHKSLSDVEAAKYIGMSVHFLRKSRSEGNRKNRTQAPPFVKINRSVRYLIDDLDAFLMQHRQVI